MTTLDTLIDYKQLVEALADAVVVAGPNGAIRFWNPAAERLFGLTEAEALGNSLDLICLKSHTEANGDTPQSIEKPDIY